MILKETRAKKNTQQILKICKISSYLYLSFTLYRIGMRQTKERQSDSAVIQTRLTTANGAV